MASFPEKGSSMAMYRLCFYVPADHAEAVKEAVFAAGAGRIGTYDCCCWQTSGIGQFRPLNGSRPFIGESGKLEHVEELKIEMVCDAGCLEPAVRALIEAHPYETPAYEFWPVNTLPGR